MKKREHLRSDALAFGAGKGSRTLLLSLGSLRSTDELYLHAPISELYYSIVPGRMQEGDRENLRTFCRPRRACPQRPCRRRARRPWRPG